MTLAIMRDILAQLKLHIGLFLNDQRRKNIKFSTTLNNQIYCKFKILGKILTYLGYKEYDGKKKPRLTVHQFSSPRTLREKNSAYGPYCF